MAADCSGVMASRSSTDLHEICLLGGKGSGCGGGSCTARMPSGKVNGNASEDGAGARTLRCVPGMLKGKAVSLDDCWVSWKNLFMRKDCRLKMTV